MPDNIGYIATLIAAALVAVGISMFVRRVRHRSTDQATNLVSSSEASSTVNSPDAEKTSGELVVQAVDIPAYADARFDVGVLEQLVVNMSKIGITGLKVVVIRNIVCTPTLVISFLINEGKIPKERILVNGAELIEDDRGILVPMQLPSYGEPISIPESCDVVITPFSPTLQFAPTSRWTETVFFIDQGASFVSGKFTGLNPDIPLQLTFRGPMRGLGGRRLDAT